MIHGATGFTGSLVAAYFARHVRRAEVRWALSGRNHAKLVPLRERLCAIEPTCADLPLLVARSDDVASLTALSRATRVVITTVGPFAELGAALLEACAENGTDYVDSAGEFSFVRAMHARFAQTATRSGALMVSCCGVDSIPTDLGVWFNLRQAPPQGPVTVTGMFAFEARPSGGTWRSVLSLMRELRRVPAVVAPPPAGGGRSVTRETGRLHRDPVLGWVLPFPTIDPEIVLRSAAALPVYGTDFRYAHYLVVRSLPRLLGLVVALACAALLAQLAPGRWLLQRMWPAGSGPSEARRARSWFALHVRARHAAGVIETRVRGGDPGYDETAKMLAESALCLAVDRARLPARAGVWTPACAFGDVLLARLTRAGLAFEVVSR